jgi:hypothetical protein
MRSALGQRRSALASALGAIAVFAIVVSVGLAAAGDPVGKVRREARAFVKLDHSSQSGGPRFTSGGGTRYDYWRVAVQQLRDNPVKGVGAGNYDRTYFLERRTTEDVRQAHSIELQMLGELGLVGGGLLLLFVLAILSGFVRRTRAGRASPGDRAIAVAGGGMFLVWLVHTSMDWLHLIPGVTGIALFGAASLVAPRSSPEGFARRSRPQVAVTAACILLATFGAVLVGRSAMADRYRGEADDAVASDPHRALDKIGKSLSLNDEKLASYYTQSAAFARLGRYQAARGSLREATRREPHDFVTWGLLGDLAVRRGDLRLARHDYGQAARLNPRDSSLRQLAAHPRLALGGG